MQIQSTDSSLPNYARPEYMAALPDLVIMADVLGGTRAMHARSTEYIKKWERENQAIYNKRRVCEPFFGGTRYVRSASVGAMHAKPVQMTWNGAETTLEKIWPNIDGAGTAGPVFMKRFTEIAISDGFALLVTSFPPRPVGPDQTPIEVHAGNQDALGIRPFVRMYARTQAINWFYETMNAQLTLTRLVLAESSVVKDSAFGVRVVESFRELYLENGAAKWRLFELVESTLGKYTFRDAGNGDFTDDAGRALSYLPVAIAYTGRTDAPLTAEIPLLEVANANIAHWCKATDIQWYEMLCAFPQRIIKGRLANDPTTNKQPTELPSGPGHAIQLEDPEGDVKWDELEGTSLTQLKESRQEKLIQMGQLGSGFLTPDKRVQETAEAHRLDAVAEQATLATAAQGIEDGGNVMLEHLCSLLLIPKEQAATMHVNTDFERKRLDPLEVQTLLQAAQTGLYTEDMVWDALIAGEWLLPDFDRETARARLRDSVVAMPSLADVSTQAVPNKKSMQIVRGADGKATALIES